VDVISTFLYSDLEEEIYMTLPEGYREKGNTALLRKYIYSLKQSAQKWYETLTHHFISYRFVTSNFDLCDLTHKTEGFFITIYVDDFTLYSSGSLMMKNLKKTLKSEFEVMDFDDFHWILEIQIKFGLKGKELSQTAYIDSILLQFSLQDYNPTILQIDQDTTLTQSNLEDVLKDIKTYQSMIGSILYLVTDTRPYLTCVESFLKQFSSALNK
jgi:hypothetical protein